jgi:hypothetical protein
MANGERKPGEAVADATREGLDALERRAQEARLQFEDGLTGEWEEKTEITVVLGKSDSSPPSTLVPAPIRSVLRWFPHTWRPWILLGMLASVVVYVLRGGSVHGLLVLLGWS